MEYAWGLHFQGNTGRGVKQCRIQIRAGHSHSQIGAEDRIMGLPLLRGGLPGRGLRLD